MMTFLPEPPTPGAACRQLHGRVRRSRLRPDGRTAAEVADRFFTDPAAVGVARRDDFPDALAGGAHIGRLGGPVLLTLSSRLHEVPAAYACAREAEIGSGFVYGGTDAVSDTAFDGLVAAINGDTCP